MSVRLFPLQSPSPNATPAIPSSRDGKTDSFQNVFANSQRLQKTNVRDESPLADNDRSKASESISRDAREAKSKAKKNNSEISGSDDDRTATSRNEKPAKPDVSQSENVEKQAENEQSNDTSDSEVTGPLEVEPVEIEFIESNSLEPTVIPQSERSGIGLPLIDESADEIDADSEDVDAEVADADSESAQSSTIDNPVIEIAEVEGEVVASDANAGLAPVPVENGPSKTTTNQGANQRASNTESLGEQGYRNAQATLGQQAGADPNADGDDQANTSLSGSSSNAESLKSTGGSSGSFALPDAAAVVEPVATEIAGNVGPMTAGNGRPANSIATSVPIAQPDTPELRDEANIARISRGLQSAVNQRGGNVTLRLDPPELGQVRIEMDVRDGVVTARFTAQTESVRRLLIDQMGQLRGALDRQGLSIEKLDVQTTANQNQGWNSSQENNHDGRSKGQHSQRQSQGQAGRQGADLQSDTFESQLNHAE